MCAARGNEFRRLKRITALGAAFLPDAQDLIPFSTNFISSTSQQRLKILLPGRNTQRHVAREDSALNAFGIFNDQGSAVVNA
jgi:hypothetical protein